MRALQRQMTSTVDLRASTLSAGERPEARLCRVLRSSRSPRIEFQSISVICITAVPYPHMLLLFPGILNSYKHLKSTCRPDICVVVIIHVQEYIITSRHVIHRGDHPVVKAASAHLQSLSEIMISSRSCGGTSFLSNAFNASIAATCFALALLCATPVANFSPFTHASTFHMPDAL